MTVRQGAVRYARGVLLKMRMLDVAHQSCRGLGIEAGAAGAGRPDGVDTGRLAVFPWGISAVGHGSLSLLLL